VSSLIRRAAAAFLVAHGVAHLVGFVGSWQLGQLRDAPYTTAILNGAIDVGDAGMRVMGVLWLAAAAAVIGAAVATWRGELRMVAVLTIGSLVVCVLGLPNAIAGVAIDAVILAALVAITLLRPTALGPTGSRAVLR
jgi:hypothetical protein